MAALAAMMIAEIVFILGKSGAGKTFSLRNLDPERTLLVNVTGKRMPFMAPFKYVLRTKSIDVIKDQLKKMPSTIKTVVLDDFGYTMTDMFMRGHTSGDQFKLYNTIADSVYGLINFIRDELPGDVIVYMIMHEEQTDTGDIKPRTIGKLLDQKVCIEGEVTICLRAMTTKDGRHFFRTQSDGCDVTKSPEGMFEDVEIPNDLALVDKRIREFWGIEDLPPKQAAPAANPPAAVSQSGKVTTASTIPAATPNPGKNADNKKAS